jgi:hypothetical protein
MVKDEDGVPEQEQVNCKCTERDYECDIGFFRDSSNSGCQRFIHDPDKPKVCNDTYVARSGLRKIEASVCRGGEDLTNKQVLRQCGLLREVESQANTFESQLKPDSLFYFPGSDVSWTEGVECHCRRAYLIGCAHSPCSK